MTANASHLLDIGDAGLLLAAVDRVPELLDDARIAPVVAMAHLVTGDWHQAQLEFQRLVPATGSIDPGLAWRAGSAAYLLGENDAAEKLLARGRTDGEDPEDLAILTAWTAALHATRGCTGAAREAAALSLESALRSKSTGALTASHGVLSELAASVGDWCEADSRHGLAVEAAERGTDVLSRIRLSIARGTRLVYQGITAEGIAELRRALELIDRSGYVIVRPQARCRLAEALTQASEYDEAFAMYSESRDAYQAMNSRRIADPLAGLGMIHRMRGQVAQARSAYEEAVQHAQASGDQQSLAVALAGLARVRAADDLDAAAVLVDLAVDTGDAQGRNEACLAKGWIALLKGDSEGAEALAKVTITAARRRRDAPGLAEALELAASARPDLGGRQLTDAIAIWTDLGSTVQAARARLLDATLRAERKQAAAVVEELRRLGVQPEWTGIADDLAKVRLTPALRIDALGKFQVIREGSVVAMTEWQSKKARDVLKILLSRRGRPITREELHSLLWPDDTEVVGNRLSVVLTTLRKVLDGSRVDGNINPAVVSDRNIVQIDLSVVDVDVERYMEKAGAALEEWRRTGSGALTSLQLAVAEFTGDFCAEDLYESWAAQTREEVSAMHSAVLRAHGAAARETGHIDLAAWSYLSLLRQDPYDESTHVDLVAMLQESGRFGEARRQYRRYVEHMTEIDVPPADYPQSTQIGFHAAIGAAG
ncbi:tetratricopeptide repeat protein [Kribbella sp. NBC_01505]|uniref:BTAD domain-containing putative transcriptional regulator n=1 Tax=Kribbella sp. NBC_01505 TaxID=2903580 RepID=UPI0038694957